MGDKQNEITVVRKALPTAAASEAAALISMIERASQNPEIDMDRVERMYAMYERAAARNARAAYDAALAIMQPQLPIVEKRGKGHNKVAYALWEDIAEAIAKVTAEHGFSLTFRVKKADNIVAVTAILAHKEGHREETTLDLPVDTSGNKNAVQAIGSSTSYGKRYTAGLLLNIITKGEDDDANTMERPNISEEKLTLLQETLAAVGANKEGFLRYMKVASLEEIREADFDRAMVALRKKGRPNG
jgi:hypothetical protein